MDEPVNYYSYFVYLSLVKFCFYSVFFAVTFCGEIKLCKIPFGRQSSVGQRNHVLVWGGGSLPTGRGNFDGEHVPADRCIERNAL